MAKQDRTTRPLDQAEMDMQLMDDLDSINRRAARADSLLMSDLDDLAAEPATDMQDVTTPEIPLYLGTPEFEQTLSQAEKLLRDSGEFDQATIDSVVRPTGMAETGFDPAVLDSMYTVAKPAFEENEAALLATMELGTELEKQGVRLGPQQWSSLRALSAAYGEEAMLGLSGAQKFRRRLSRRVGEDFALVSSVALRDWQLGLSMLDQAQRAVNKFRITVVSPALDDQEKRRLEQTYLPPVRLRDRGGETHEFRSQLAAQWHQRWSEAWGSLRWQMGNAAELFGTVVHNGEVKEWGQAVSDAGREDFLDSAAMIPAINSATTPHMRPLEAIGAAVGLERTAEIMTDPNLTSLGLQLSEEERQAVLGRVAEEGDLWPVWAELNEAGAAGLYDMATFVGMDTGLEIVEDPFLITGNVAGKAFPAARKIVGWAAPRATARATSLAARGTADMSDAVAAVRAAEKVMKQAEAKAVEAASLNNGVIPAAQVEELVVSRRSWLNEKTFLDRFTEVPDGEARDLLQRSSRRNPAYTPETTKIVRVEKEIVPPEPPAQIDLFDVPERVQESLAKTRGETPKIKTKTVTERRAKSVEELAKERDQFRQRELSRETDWSLETTANDLDSPQGRQRQLFGPDDAEQAGDALNVLIRTGGLGVDDVALTPSAVEYAWDAKRVTSRFEWGLVDDVTKTERQLGLAGGTRQMDLGTSSLRSVARREDIVKRAHGAARRLGLKDDIEVLEAELKNVRKARKKLQTKQNKLKNPPKDYEPGWAPQDQPGIMHDANRYNRWLQSAGDRVVRGLYPGALLMKMGNSHLGQMFSPLRDPLRYLQTYDPAAGEHLRVAYRRYEQDIMAHNEIFTNVLQRSGVLKKRGAFDRTANFSEFSINKARSEQLFDLLDNVPGSKEHKKLMLRADDSMKAAHDEIRVVMDNFADMHGVTGTSRYLQGYMRHVVTEDMFSRRSRPLEFIGLSGKAEVFTSHLLKRSGNKVYDKDIVSVLDLYNRAAFRKIHLEPVYHDLRLVGADLARKYGSTKHSNYMKAVVDNLQGRPSFLGKAIDGFNGKPMDASGKVRWQPGKGERALTGLTTLLWMMSIPGNARYGLMQMLAGTTTGTARTGMLRTSRGMLHMMSEEGQAMAHQLGFYDTVNTMMESNSMRKAADMLSQRTGINRIEAFVRGVTAHAAIDQQLTDLGMTSWNQAVKAGAHHRILFNAMRQAEEVNHMYGPLARSPYINRIFGQPVGSSMTQFTLYPLKQTEELVSIADKNPGKIIEYYAMSGWLTRLFAENTGIDVSRWTGFGFVDEMGAGIPESPFSDLLQRQVDLNQAMNEMDPINIQQKATNWIKGLETLTPVLARDVLKRSSRLQSGQERDSREALVRNLFHGEGDSFIERVVTGLQPSMGARETAAPSLGGDLIPDLLLQPSIRDRLQRHTTRQLTREKKTFMLGAQKLLNGFADAVQDGSGDAALDLAKQLEKIYQIRIGDIDDRTEAVFTARYLSANIRALADNPNFADIFIDIVRQSGVGLE